MADRGDHRRSVEARSHRPLRVARQWAAVDRSARFAETPEFVGRYTGQWVAVWNCEVIATADSIEALRGELDRCGAPPMETYTALVQPDPPAGALIATPLFL